MQIICDHLRVLQGGELIWKAEVDTYFPEIARYGGSDGLRIAEEIFCHDSEAVLSGLLMERHTAGEMERWRMAITSIDALYNDLRLACLERIALCNRRVERLAAEFGLTEEHRATLGKIWRRRQTEVVSTVSSQDSIPFKAACLLRSKALNPLIAQYSRIAFGDVVQRNEIILSLVHMTSNRIFDCDSRKQEMVSLGLLSRYYVRQLNAPA